MKYNNLVYYLLYDANWRAEILLSFTAKLTKLTAAAVLGSSPQPSRTPPLPERTRPAKRGGACGARPQSRARDPGSAHCAAA